MAQPHQQRPIPDDLKLLYQFVREPDYCQRGISKKVVKALIERIADAESR